MALMPFVLLVVYLFLVSLEKLMYFVVFFVPLSIPLDLFAPSLGFDLQLPTEPILIMIMGIFIFRLLYEKKFDRGILLHPVSIAIYINLAWMFLTSLTSSIPLVSFKFLLSRLWFVSAFYFMATQIFQKKKGIRLFIWAYIPAMLVVIIYTWIHLTQLGGLSQHAAHLAPIPFFRDHTSYGAILAMLLPFAVGFAINPKYTPALHLLSWLMAMILLVALLFSYTRAAWISVIIAGGVLVIMVLKIRFRTVLIFVTLVGLVIFINRANIFMNLRHNHQDSSKDLAKHLESVSNVRTDASNLERMNRWKSGFRMFLERPVLGWGPNTYQFNYAPFQIFKDKTVISTNSGNMGNSHSEYIGPLVESGVFGCLSILIIIILTLSTGFRVYAKATHQRQIKILVASATLGLITYYIHGALNDFLDTDKASALFWGYTAMIVSLDVYHARKVEKPFDSAQGPSLLSQ